jgi:4-amino-4-deoxy-L-arabinose transferase-like glycosyltransferase
MSYVALLLGTVHDLGYARDEGFYFRATYDYKGWFDILFSNPTTAFTQASVDKHFRTNHEHPAFVKSLFALSWKFLYYKFGLFRESGTAARFPAMVLAGTAIAVTYLWGKRSIGRLPGFVAAALLAMQPAIFFHSHLACFDVAVMSMWLVTTYSYYRSIESKSVFWAVLTGVLYGLELNTKHNAWLLPPALIVHFVLTRGRRGLLRDLKVGRTRLPLALGMMAVLGPLVFFGTWPWLWFDTGRRLVEYITFHVNHEYYNMEFLGVTYFRPPMPRLYAWVMTIATVPSITIILFVIGLVRSARELPFLPKIRAQMPGIRVTLANAYSSRALWLLCLLTSYAPWLSSTTPIFGGTKHWITAYPFLCLFAGLGFDWAMRHIASLAPAALRRFRVADLLVTASVLAGPIVMTLHSHPWGLSAYVPAVGGEPGGATLGLNRSFWGYTTGAVRDFLNQRAPPRAQVYLHDTAFDSWVRYTHDGRIRKELDGTLTLSSSNVALYHHEQHMRRVEYQLWVDYGTVAPAHIGAYDGVPIVWVYVRPK